MSLAMGMLLIAIGGFFIAALMSCLSIGQQEDEQRDAILAVLQESGDTRKRFL